jgi:hypothetical protein
MSRCSPTVITVTLTTLPNEVIIHTLTYLRAFDLSPVQQTCRFFNNPGRIHDVVSFFVEHVYGSQFASGVTPAPLPLDAGSGDGGNGKEHSAKKRSKGNASMKGSAKSAVGASSASDSSLYSLAHLRSIELTVVARLLSLPEPKTGFYVSKSWIKKTLLWLETVNEPTTAPASAKKLSKKEQRQRTRRLSDVSPPWPNANSDILCNHHNLQRCSAKAARSRRKLMDKQAWKVLRKLYPDSTQLESKSGECLQCLLDNETARKTEHDRLEQEKIQRKQPLSNPHVRRFYTRTKGVPTHCLVTAMESSSLICSPAAPTRSSNFTSSLPQSCPLTSGTYVILPRAWCHHWRRYMKTGEGSVPLPPDSSAVLCDAHKLALLPPHLEAYLRGETPQLLASVKPPEHSLASSGAAYLPPASPVGVQPTLDIATLNALMAAGVSQTELAAQRLAMMQLQGEHQQQLRGMVPPPPRDSSSCNNDLLDRENHVVVELVTVEEWQALQETGCWPNQVSNYVVSVTVPPPRNDGGHPFHFSTLPCRDCDPTGLRFTSCASIKNKFRSKRWEPKSVEQKRVPNLEY